MKQTTPTRRTGAQTTPAWRAIIPAAVLAAALGAFVCRPAVAADWPQWRGPDRTGVTPETSGWPGGWPPKRLWAKNVGYGCTSPVIWRGRLYVMGWHGRRSGSRNPTGIDRVYCLDSRTGREIWRQSYRARYQGRVRTGDTGAYGGPSSTPTLDTRTGWLYTLNTDGELRCWDANRQGRLVWSKNLYAEYRVPQRPTAGGGRRDYGFSCSPLIQGDLLILEVGERAGTVMALDKRTGKRLWASACREPAGHTGGPVAITVQGVGCIAALALRKLVVMRADGANAGKTVAEYPWRTEYACNVATPAVAGNRIIITSNYNHDESALVEISLAGARMRWKSPHHAAVCSPVIHKQRVFLVDGKLQCIDLATGKLIFSGGSFYHGSCLVTADDKVIVFGKGRLALVEAAGRDGRYRQLSRVDRIVRGICYPHVVLSNGVICCKDRDGNLVALSVAPPKPKPPGSRGE